ncbi:hypothetical protein EDB92DRAFT_1804429, partial [Lactarius akahatsu]
MEGFPKLWVCIQEWVKTSNQSTFDSVWEWIQTQPAEVVPPSFVDYLKTNWMNIVPLWAGILRLHQMIFQEGDTNMLIEVYHHILKSKWLEGKWNQHVDHLVHTLVMIMLPSYVIQHVHQELGFEGLNLASKRHTEILK